MLCPNHDRLFDQSLITFSDNGTIIISKLLTPKNLLGLIDNMQIICKFI
ncbi:hypothetical protein G8C92_28125 [Paenibacillus donghaensis]|nr:hypothetical protein [Paenibacillus donghaensis]